MFIEAYGRWVTQLRRDYSARQRSGPLTDESDCSSWPTVTIGDAKESQSYKRGNPQLHIAAAMWPTVRTADAKDSRYQYDHGDKTKPRPTLSGKVRNWPTPKTPTGGGQARRKTPGGGLRKLEDVIVGLQGRVSRSTRGKSRGLWAMPAVALAVQGGPGGQEKALNKDIKGKLNPDWVEQLMGIPVHWTLPKELEEDI